MSIGGYSVTTDKSEYHPVSGWLMVAPKGGERREIPYFVHATPLTLWRHARTSYNSHCTQVNSAQWQTLCAIKIFLEIICKI
jgi:hypothetical protein